MHAAKQILRLFFSQRETKMGGFGPIRGLHVIPIIGPHRNDRNRVLITQIKLVTAGFCFYHHKYFR